MCDRETVQACDSILYRYLKKSLFLKDPYNTIYKLQ